MTKKIGCAIACRAFLLYIVTRAASFVLILLPPSPIRSVVLGLFCSRIIMGKLITGQLEFLFCYLPLPCRAVRLAGGCVFKELLHRVSVPKGTDGPSIASQITSSWFHSWHTDSFVNECRSGECARENHSLTEHAASA